MTLPVINANTTRTVTQLIANAARGVGIITSSRSNNYGIDE